MCVFNKLDIYIYELDIYIYMNLTYIYIYVCVICLYALSFKKSFIGTIPKLHAAKVRYPRGKIEVPEPWQLQRLKGNSLEVFLKF